MTDVLALDDEIVCKEEERDEYGPMHTDEYEVKEWILKIDGQRVLFQGPKWTVTVRRSLCKLNKSWSNWTIKTAKSGGEQIITDDLRDSKWAV